MTMQRKITGRKIAYRPMIEAELTPAERRQAYDHQGKARQLRCAHTNLVAMASRDRAGFETLSRWIVVTCRAGTEITISEELERQRIMCWCPVSKHRRAPKRGMKAVEIVRAVFRGYLFVRLIPEPEAYAGLLSASRVTGIMALNGATYVMPERLMSLLMLRAHSPEIANLSSFVRVGQIVDVRSGPFASFQATVRQVLGKQGQLRCELPLFGRMTTVMLDLDDVKI